MEEKRDPGYRSLFWPILLIGVGLIWLLGNMDILPSTGFRVLFRLWPLILVVIGLDILFGRRSPVIGALIGLGAVALAIALIYMAPSLGFETSGELKTLQFSEPLEGATSARIDLDLERYSTTIEALSDSNSLIEAELDTVTDVNFTARGDRQKSVSLRPETDFGFDIDWDDLLFSNAKWEIGLSPEVPTDLIVDVGSGSATLDLMDLDLTDLDIDGGSGSVRLTLPASSSRYDVTIDGASGSFDIELDEGADIRAQIDVASGSLNIEIGSAVDLDADIDGGSGSVSIDVPGDVGVRVVVRSSGSGSVRVPGSYELVDDRNDDDRNTGIWESGNFSTAAHTVEITFDPESGSFTLR